MKYFGKIFFTTFAFLLFSTCAITQPVQEPQQKQQNEPEFYIPSFVNAAQLQCVLGMTSPASIGLDCKAIPFMPSWAECLPNYHKEKQVICTSNQSEPTTSRTVCHLNVARGYTHLCGLECTMRIPTEAPQIIIPPNLDRNEASR